MWCMGVLCPHQKTKERRKQHEAFCEQQHDDGDVPVSYTHLTQLPYGVTVAAVSFVSFLIAGLLQNVVICMIIAVVLMIATLLVIAFLFPLFQNVISANK